MTTDTPHHLPTTSRPVDDFGFLENRDAADDIVKPRRIDTALESGQRMSAIRWGEGPVEVLYLHGGGQNAHTWDLVAALVGAPALALDLPGHGHSAWRDDKNYGAPQNARAVREVLLATKTSPRLVVGMSLGGLTAIALAQSAPDLVRRLIVVDILPKAELDGASFDRSRPGQLALLDGPRQFESLKHMEEAAIAATGGNRPVETIKRGVWHNSLELPDGTWRWRYDDLSSAATGDTSGLWGALEAVAAPFTLVTGGASPLVSDDQLVRLREIKPNSSVVTVPGAGHAVQRDAPEALAAVIGAALG